MKVHFGTGRKSHRGGEKNSPSSKNTPEGNEPKTRETASTAATSGSLRWKCLYRARRGREKASGGGGRERRLERGGGFVPGLPRGALKRLRGSGNWGVRDTHSSPHPPGGEGGWRRGLRAAEGWCLLGGKGRALPVVGEGLRAGESPRIEAAPCPLVGGTC